MAGARHVPPWECDISEDPDVLPAWVARYPGHGDYTFVAHGGGFSMLTFVGEDGTVKYLESPRGNMPGAATPVVVAHLATVGVAVDG